MDYFTEINQYTGVTNDDVLLYLVANGLKPGGELEMYSSYLKNTGEVISLLEKNDLECHLIEYCEGSRTRVHGIFFWKKGEHSQENVREDTEKWVLEGGEFDRFTNYFLGFPKCCIDAYDHDGKNGTIYLKKFDKRHKKEGMEGITDFIGLSHVPCSMDCEDTKKLGHGRALMADVPKLFIREAKREIRSSILRRLR